MHVIFSSVWDRTRAAGQVRLLADLWLEYLATDASPVYWPPLFSTLQLLKNCRQILRDIDRGVLKGYHARDVAAEIVERFDEKPWLVKAYPVEWAVVKAELDGLTAEKAEDRAERGRTLRLLGAFVDKVEAADPIRKQRDALTGLVSEDKTPYEVIARAVADLTNDLLHRGHSQPYLHGWLLAAVVAANGQPYLDNFGKAEGLGDTSRGDYEVLLRTFATGEVRGNKAIRFTREVPPAFEVLEDSSLRQTRTTRLAVVQVAGCMDWQAAVGRARASLERYLSSTPLERLRFDREVSGEAAVRKLPDGPRYHTGENRPLLQRTITNAERFYSLQGECNDRTYAELDRVMYWFEQSRSRDDLGRLISLWTALEFLFGQSGEKIHVSIAHRLAAYVIPRYARLLVLDLKTFLGRIELAWPGALLEKLNARLRDNRYHSTDLLALAKVFCIDDPGNELLPVIRDYPMLMRKHRRVFRLLHPWKKSTEFPAVWHDIDRFERSLLHDVRYAYRVRNAVVHDAAVEVPQLDRLVQRLNWMLCTAMDCLIFQFAHHPRMDLQGLHETNVGSYHLWKETLRNDKHTVSLDEILSPICHGLPVTQVGG
jgi:hypothetical protein